MRSVVFVGARNIDLDLQLEQYNDDSEYTYRRLQSMFEQKRERETRRADQNQGSDGR